MVQCLNGLGPGPPRSQALSRGIVDAAEFDIGGESQGLAEARASESFLQHPEPISSSHHC